MSAYSAMILAEAGIAHYWRLGEATGNPVDQVAGSTITAGYSNGPTLGVAGLITGDADTCIQCNGVNQFVDMHVTTAVRNANQTYTWEAWCTPMSATGSFLRILGADDQNANGPALIYDGPSNTFKAWRVNTGSQISAHGSGINIPYHIVVTYDGRVLRIYINGASRGGIIDTGAITTIGGTFCIGSSGNYGSFWNGKLDEVALYTTCLTGTRIKAHYRQGLNSLLAANNAHWYGAYVNTGQSWDASPPTTYTELDTWSNWATNNGATTHKPGLFHCFQNWANNGHFPTALAQQANQRGANIMVTWEAWDPGFVPANGHKADQPIYALQNIINNNFDSYITTWANDIKTYGQTVFLRLFHEFNGDYYPWSIVQDANNANQADYSTGVNTEARIALAFKHVRDIFTAQGVTNVKWIWCPNIYVDNYSYNPFTAASYPGDAYVDYTALDVLNYSGNSSASIWTTFFDQFSQAYDTLMSITSKPVLIPELASSEDSSGFYTKSGWITEMMGTAIPQAFPGVVGVIYVDDAADPSSTTLSVNSSAASLSAFQAQIASSQYAGGSPYAVTNPTPTITSISPTFVVAGSGQFTLTVTGTNFVAASVVDWNGTALATTFVSATQLTAVVPGSDVAIAGTATITVVNP